MEPRTRIKIMDVKRVGELARQQPAPAQEEVSRQGAILMIVDDLVALHEQGHSWPWIAQWLGEHGIPITVRALQQVLRRVRQKKKNDTKGKALRTSAVSSKRTPAAASPPDMNSATAGRPPAVARARESGVAGAPRAPAAGLWTPAPSTAPSRPPSAEAAPPPGTFVIRPDTPDL
jgi:hypothetical protein